MNLNFSSKDVALAKKINFDLIAKHFKALEEGNDIILDIPQLKYRLYQQNHP